MNENTNVRLVLDDTTIYASEYTLSPMSFTSKNTIHEMEIKKGYMDINLDPFIEKRLKAEREKVWELAKAINLAKEDGGMRYVELEDCFGTRKIERIMKNYSVDKALEKYEAWKKENSVKDLIKSLKPQDVIAVSDYFCFSSNETKRVFMITKIEIAFNGMTTISGFDKTGSHVLFAKQYNEYKGLEKIGRVVETTDILGEIKKIEDEWRKNKCGS